MKINAGGQQDPLQTDNNRHMHIHSNIKTSRRKISFVQSVTVLLPEVSASKGY